MNSSVFAKSKSGCKNDQSKISCSKVKKATRKSFCWKGKASQKTIAKVCKMTKASKVKSVAKAKSKAKRVVKTTVKKAPVMKKKLHAKLEAKKPVTVSKPAPMKEEDIDTEETEESTDSME